MGTKNIFMLLALLVLFYFMSASARPTISAGDTAELAASAAVLGVAHSPGYPLYTLSGKILGSLMPFANFAYRVNIGSVLKAISALFVLYLLISRFSSFGAFAAVLFMAGSAIFWKEALIAEVFSLNMLCAAVLTYIMVRDTHEKHDARGFEPVFLISFLFGFFLGNHHTLLLMAPAVCCYVYFKLNGLKPAGVLKVLGTSSVFFVLGLSVYIFLPLRSMNDPLLDWEDPKTLERFWGVVARLRYGSLSLAMGESRGFNPAHIMESAVFYLRVLAKNYPYAGLAAFLAGAIKLYVENRRVFAITVLALFFTGPFMFILANVPHNVHTEYIMERFLMLSLLPLTIFAGYALGLADKKFRIILFAVLISAGIYDAGRRFSENIAYRHSLQIYDTGKNVFRHLPRGSMLIADRADETEFALAYLIYEHGVRKDIDYIDANAGVTRSVYGDEYYKIWGRRRLDIRNVVESRLIRDYTGPVYYATLLPGQTSTPKNPSGMLYVSKGAVFGHPEAWKYVLVPPRGEYKGDEREVQMYVNYYTSLADYYLKVNRFEDSIRFYKNSLSAAGRWSRWGLNPAYELHRSGYLDMAEEMYRSVLQRHSGNTQALNNLGAIYNESGRLDLARDAFEKLVLIDPNSAEGYYNLSIVEWKQNNNAEAIKNLEKAVKLKPDYQEALSFLIKLRGGR